MALNLALARAKAKVVALSLALVWAWAFALGQLALISFLRHGPLLYEGQEMKNEFF